MVKPWLASGLGVVDPPLPPQPLPVVEAPLGPLERPGVPGGIGQALVEVSLGVDGVGEQPAGAGRELFQPGPGSLVRLGQRALQEGACLKVTLGADRGGGKVGDAEVGDVVVQRGAVRAEELAQLRVGGQAAALGQGRDAPGMLGPAGEPGYSVASTLASALARSGRTWSRWPRMASTVAAAKSAEAATVSIL